MVANLEAVRVVLRRDRQTPVYRLFMHFISISYFCGVKTYVLDQRREEHIAEKAFVFYV